MNNLFQTKIRLKVKSRLIIILICKMLNLKGKPKDKVRVALEMGLYQIICVTIFNQIQEI